MTMTLSGTSGGIGVIGSGTAVASTSGTSIDFTSLPAGLKRITVMFNGVSTSGSSLVQIQIGSGSVTTTGYQSCAITSSTVATSTTGLLIAGVSASGYVRNGIATIATLGSNVWVSSGTLTDYVNTNTSYLGGTITLGGTLDRVRITTVNGTDTFDAGSINILYE